jgi:UDP:flavonoid glycosyltransferase YjiC (YdhE family)
MVRRELDGIFTGPNAPGLLIAGYFVGLEALIAYHLYGVPLIILTTFLRHPQEDPATFARGKLIYMPEQLRYAIMRGATGNPDITLEDFLDPLRQAKELIPCPQDFDFADDDWEHGATAHYVEPMISRSSLSSDPLDVPPPLPTPEGKRVIFATSGSQVADYEDKAKLFFQALIDMMKTEGMEEYHLVLAVGDKLLEFFNVQYGVDESTGSNDLPDNVTLQAWVSQLDILKTADVVFMHGGLATIKESIFEGVPIIIFPHGKDQTENALRIVRGGLGLLPDDDRVTPQSLRKLLTEATSNTWIRQKIAGMQALFQLQDSAVPPASIPIIEGVVPPTP